jgi:tetratricopeptide (TPR) repeat protein
VGRLDYYGFMKFKNRVAVPLRNRAAPPSALKSLGFALLASFWVLNGAFAQTPSVPSTGLQPGPAAGTDEPLASALDGELFFQLMLAELTVIDGEPSAGYQMILDAARKTRDARLYERAVKLALQSRSAESALQAARAWKQALPNSREANRYLLQLFLGLNRIAETLEPLKSEIAASDVKDRAATIGAVPASYARASDKKAATSVVEQALAQYLDSAVFGAAAWSAIGQVRLDGGDAAGALEAARKAQALDPAAEGAVVIALNLMGPKTPAAEQLVLKYLQGSPKVEMRMAYARALLEAQRYPQAGEQLKIVTTEKPDHPQAWLIKGTLELQDKKIDQAERSLKRHMEITQGAGGSSPEANRGLVQAYLSLSQIAEQRKDLPLAEAWLKRIDNADDMISAQSRRAAILAKQGKLQEGRLLLRSLPESSPEDARQKMMAEVQLLRDNKAYKIAYDLVAEKAKTSEGDHELIYDKAMLAEKLGRLDEMELLLRGVIAAKPDYQHAYNALGYSLAERKLRLPEARALILKALELAPNDPFITDSLGWVEFQSGNLAEALRILQGAFESKPDAEIAAHLGEVLWASGKREQALTVWREGVALNAENETLIETLKRLRVKP